MLTRSVMTSTRRQGVVQLAEPFVCVIPAQAGIQALSDAPIPAWLVRIAELIFSNRSN